MEIYSYLDLLLQQKASKRIYRDLFKEKLLLTKRVQIDSARAVFLI